MKSYIDRQKEWVDAMKLKKGDKLLVTRKPEYSELMEWGGVWTDELSDLIGKRGRVVEKVVSEKGILLLSTESDNWLEYFPYFVLEKESLDYLEKQKEWAFSVDLKKGDKVKITQSSLSYEKGWNNVWLDDMDEIVGMTGTYIDGIEKSHGLGVLLDEETPSERHGIRIPYFILDKIGFDKTKKDWYLLD